MNNSGYLSAFELADLVGCKPNQRMLMTKWLENNNWSYIQDRNGFPKVARAYHDKQLGVIAKNAKTKTEESPNIRAFDFLGQNRYSKAI